MKKKYIFSSCAVCLLILVITVSIRIFFFEPEVPSRIESIKPNIVEYSQVAEYLYNDFSKYNSDIFVYSVPSDINDNNILCCSDKHELMLTKSIQNDFSVISNSYRLDKHSLDHVTVYDNFVSFGYELGRAAYVYSVNGEKPKHINSPKEDGRVLVKKIADNWYFVTKPDKFF